MSSYQFEVKMATLYWSHVLIGQSRSYLTSGKARNCSPAEGRRDHHSMDKTVLSIRNNSGHSPLQNKICKSISKLDASRSDLTHTDVGRSNRSRNLKNLI